MPSEEKFRVLERQAGNMNTNYLIGDFLIRVKNAVLAKNKELSSPESKQVFEVAKALCRLGFLDDVKKVKGSIALSLTFKNKKPALRDIKLVSKPGLRIYMGVDEIGAKRGSSTFLISTPKGIVSTKEALKHRMGGEVIAEIW
jgi:small subunit ribosomal protein S8